MGHLPSRSRSWCEYLFYFTFRESGFYKFAGIYKRGSSQVPVYDLVTVFGRKREGVYVMTKISAVLYGSGECTNEIFDHKLGS